MYFHHSLVGKLAWLIVSLAAISIGLSAAHVFNFYDLGFVANSPHVRMILDYVVGIAGVLSLFGLFIHCYRCMSGEDECRVQNQHHGR